MLSERADGLGKAMRGLAIAFLGLLEIGNIAAPLAGYWSLGDSTAISLVVLVGCLALSIPDIVGRL